MSLSIDRHPIRVALVLNRCAASRGRPARGRTVDGWLATVLLTGAILTCAPVWSSDATVTKPVTPPLQPTAEKDRATLADFGDPAELPRWRPGNFGPKSKVAMVNGPDGLRAAKVTAVYEKQLAPQTHSPAPYMVLRRTVEPGQLFALDRMTHEPVTILVNGKPFANGEVVAMGERFGVRLLNILPGGAG